MTSIMLTISFLIHIILLVAIYYLFKEIQQLKVNPPKNITHIFEKYLQEIRDENDRLKAEATPITDEPSVNPTGQKFEQEAPEKLQYMPEIVETEDTTETSLQSQILQLYHQGISPNDIAKKLNCGKTEVDLSIKFYKKENS